MKCGNCQGNHADLEAVRLCHQGKTQPTIGPSTTPYVPDPNRIVTGTCRKLSCHNTKTGTIAELAGWACDEHSNTFTVGSKARWHDKRWEILEITDDGQARLRTGGAGKLVALSELQAA